MSAAATFETVFLDLNLLADDAARPGPQRRQARALVEWVADCHPFHNSSRYLGHAVDDG